MSDVRSDAPPVSDSPLSLFGFQILSELGRDRLGVVYHARMVLYRREVALRLVADEAHTGVRDLTPICRNAEEISRHPHSQLLKIYEVGESGGQLYLATELPPGSTLRDRLAKGPLEIPAAVSLIASVAAAVGHLHKQHLTHFDLTSSAIYPSGDAPPAVGELGLAGLLHGRHGAPYPGDPAYAAPEQLAGSKADARADVYALGVLLVECLTGKKPQDHPSMKDVPPALVHICKKATDASPSHRYADAGALADDLERFVHGDAPAPGMLGNAVDWMRRNPLVAGLATAVALLLIGSTILVTMLALSAASARAEAEQARQGEMEVRKAAGSLKIADVPKDDNKLKLALQSAEQKAQLAQRATQREHANTKAEAEAHSKTKEELKDEIKRRGIAEEKVRLANEDRQAAIANAAATASELSRAHAAYAASLIDAGDLSGALLPFTRALAIAKREKIPEDAYRLRLAVLLSRLPRPLSIVRFPKGDVSSVAFSPDGSRVLVAGADGVAYLVSATSGEMVGKKVVHGAPITKGVFSPDGKRVLTADAKGKIRMWKEDGEMVFEPIDLETPATHVGFSADGKRFYLLRPTMGDEPGTEAQVRDAEKGDAYTGIVTVVGAPLPAALSFDGKRLLLGSGRTANLYDASSGKTVGPAFDHGATLAGTALSADGKFVVTWGDGSARVWNVATGKSVLPKLEQAAGLDPQFDEGGRLVLTVGEDGFARVFNVVTGKQAGPAVRPGAGVPRQALLSPDGRSILLSYADGMAKLLDVKTGQPVLPPLAHAAPLAYAAASGDGTRLATFDGRVLHVWDVTGGEPFSPAGPPADAKLIYSPDGKRALRIDGETVHLETVTAEKVTVSLKHKGDVKRAAFSPAGDLIVTVSDPPPGATTPTWDVRVWDVTTGKSLFDPIEHLREVFRADFVLNGTRIVTLSLDKQARLFEAKTGKMFGKPVEHKEDLTLADVSPDGKRLVTCDKGGQVRAWDVGTGDTVGQNMPHAGTVRTLVFSPDSKRLATCCENGTAFVWTLAKGEQLTKLELSDAVTHAAFGPEGKTLLTACDDGTARLWNVTNGKPLTAPLRHEAPVRRVAFSEDGRWLLTAAGRNVRLWDAKTGEALGPPLPHSRGDVVVTSVSLSKAGELVTQAGPGTRWSRSLIPSKRDVKDLFDLAVALSGREEAGPGQLAPAEPETLTGAWRRTLAAHGDDFVPPQSRLLAWARRGVKECEARDLSGGLARHLSVLLEGSTDAGLFARRAKAYAEMGRHEAALADYDKALEKNKDRWQWRAGRGASALALGKWDAAAADLTEATKRQDRDAVLWRQLGQAEAERGKWKESALALNRATRSETPPEVWLEQALALLSADDEKGYKQACLRLAKKYGKIDDAAIRRAVADACVLGADAVPDYKSLLATAEASVKAAPDEPGEQVRYAALLLRAGQAAAAVKILEKVAEGSRTRPGDLWLLALAYQKAGDKEKAKQTQEKAGEAKTADGTPWTQRQATALWRKEAGG